MHTTHHKYQIFFIYLAHSENYGLRYDLTIITNYLKIMCIQASLLCADLFSGTYPGVGYLDQTVAGL